MREWEAGFHEYVKAQFPNLGDTIRKEKVVSKDSEAELRRALDQYKASRA